MVSDPAASQGERESGIAGNEAHDPLPTESAAAPVDAGGLSGADEKPRGLHPVSLPFELISHVGRVLVPAAFGLLSAAGGNVPGMVIAGIIVGISIVFATIHFLTLRYVVARGQLLVRTGFIFRRVRTIPLNRIQNIDLVENPLHRLFGVAEVRIETASGSEAEATLRVLSISQVERLRRELFGRHGLSLSREPATDGADGAEFLAAEGREQGGEVLLTIPLKWLILGGLSSDRGWLVIGLLVTGAFQLHEADWFDPRNLIQFIPRARTLAGNIALWGSLGLALIVLLRVLSAGWYLVRFYGYRLVRHGEDLRISCGLLTRVSATVPRRRIQFISVHRSWMMRCMRLAAIRIETAGGGAGQENNQSLSVSRRWFVPVVSESAVHGLLQILRPGIVTDESQLEWQRLSPTARPRMVRLSIVVSLVVAAPGMWQSLRWGWLPGAILAPLAVYWSIRTSRSTRYSRYGDQLTYRSGILTRKTSTTFLDKVQVARFSQSPFDRRWGHATLSVDTAAAGPAEHRIDISFLDAEFAHNEYQRVSRLCAGHPLDFG